MSASAEIRQVVLLYDERTDLPGLAQIDASFVETLTSDSSTSVEIYREEMDLSRFASETYLLELRDHLRTKYSGKKIDVVVAVMGPALDFLLVHAETIFPGTPIVFCGIGMGELEDRNLPSHVTGVMLKRAFSPTLRLALKLQPDAKRVVFVAGTSGFDRRILEQAKAELYAYEDRLQFTYLTKLPLNETLEQLSRLLPRTIVLYSTMFQDGMGNDYVPHDVAELVSAAANTPVYAFVDQYLGRGITGGDFYSLEKHGEQPANLVREILDGKEPSTLAPVELGTTVAMLDWRQLQRWRIPESRLPADAVIRFRPASFWSLWSQYELYVIGALAVVTMQALMIAGLLLERARRRRIESELRESEYRMWSMANTAPVMIWIAGTDRLLTFVNKVWLDFTGATQDAEIGSSWIARVHPDDMPRCRALYEQSFDGRQDFTMECRLRRHDGEYRWVLCTSVPRFSLGGDFLGYIGSCVDISARKEAELERQRHREELAHVTRVTTIGELTASIIHELKQPLAAILNNAEAAEMFLDTEPPALDEVREILADIRKDDISAAEIIAGVRTLLQKQESARTRIEINEMIEGVVKLVSIEATACKVAIQFASGKELPPVIGERIHLQQVVMNLILNAFDAMQAVPQSRRRLTVRTSNGDGLVKISVSDSGPGIPADKLPKVFDPFFTTKKEGLGMGLSISRTIVEAHDGRISVESHPGTGATFVVALPEHMECVT